jgi:AbrB family looped-hinge helix DNA binding protein
MTVTKVSPKFQVVIPKAVRDQVPIKSGQQVTMVVKGGVIYIVPRVPLAKLRGSLRALPARGFREKTDRI